MSDRRSFLQPMRDEFNPGLNMLWLEVTNNCNELCPHCYNDSGEHRANEVPLAWEKWEEILADGVSCGARHVQFIGGEPTLVPWLPKGLARARELGYEKVELYTNGTRMYEELYQSVIKNGVHVATSVYSHRAFTHDQITKREGSLVRTLGMMLRLKTQNVPLRVAVIAMPMNDGDVEGTVKMIRDLGIENVGVDQARAFGRAEALVKREKKPEELCGQCWNGTLCIKPQGDVSLCIMHREVVGNAATTRLAEIAGSLPVFNARKAVHDNVYLPRLAASNPCGPAWGGGCNPHRSGCGPKDHNAGVQALDVCLPGADPATAEIMGVSEFLDERCPPQKINDCEPKQDCSPALAPVQPEAALVGVNACLPNSPNPPAPCFPASTPTTPCAPHTCGPQTAPCYPLGCKPNGG